MNISDVPAEVIEKEKEIYREQFAGKAEMAEKIIEGKLSKFYEEVCLMEQAFFRDSTLTVGGHIANAVAKMGEKVVVSRFTRYVLGN